MVRGTVRPRSGDLVAGSDGFLARYVRVQSMEKLHYVQRYCSIFSRGMSHKWAHRVYVDLFCGPGRCLIDRTGDEIDGSPVIAQKSIPQITKLYLNDLDPSAIQALQGRMAALGATSAEYFTEDRNIAARLVARELDRLPSRSLISLCFLDPTNWQITFRSVKLLTQAAGWT